MTFTLQEAIDSIEYHPAKAQQIYQQVQRAGLLDTPIRDGAWTPRQILHHVADSHLNSYTRIKLALTEDTPTVKPYAEAAWAELNDVSDIPVDTSLNILSGIHERITSVLRYLLAEEQEKFERTFYHPEADKEFTIEQYTKSFANHGRKHLDAITTLLEQHS